MKDADAVRWFKGLSQREQKERIEKIYFREVVVGV